MIIDRRSFIQEVALIASSVIFAEALPLSPAARALAEAGPRTTDSGFDSQSVTFKIVGWDLELKEAAKDEVVILINHSWRATWR